jgi:hypothetical protein
MYCFPISISAYSQMLIILFMYCCINALINALNVILLFFSEHWIKCPSTHSHFCPTVRNVILHGKFESIIPICGVGLRKNYVHYKCALKLWTAELVQYFQQVVSAAENAQVPGRPKLMSTEATAQDTGRPNSRVHRRPDMWVLACKCKYYQCPSGYKWCPPTLLRRVPAIELVVPTLGSLIA